MTPSRRILKKQGESVRGTASFLFAGHAAPPMMPARMKRLAIILCAAIAALLRSHALATAHLEKGDVEQIIARAASRAADLSQHSIIAVIDREGYVLGVWEVNGEG